MDADSHFRAAEPLPPLAPQARRPSRAIVEAGAGSNGKSGEGFSLVVQTARYFNVTFLTDIEVGPEVTVGVVVT